MISSLRKASAFSVFMVLSFLTFIFGLISLVLIQNRTISLLQERCDIVTLTPIHQEQQLQHLDIGNNSQQPQNKTDQNLPSEGGVGLSRPSAGAPSPSNKVTISRSSPKGVAFTIFLGSPKWFQNRYSMMINLLLGALPAEWLIQIFYLPNNKMSKEAVSHPGIQRQIQKGNVQIVPIPQQYSKLKKRELMVQPWLWRQLKAEKVLTFGGTNVLCSNSPLDLDEDFGDFDYVGSPASFLKGVGGDGGLSLRNRTAMMSVLSNYKDGLTKGLKKADGEDVFFLKNMLKVNKNGASSVYNIASVSDTLAFALNDGSKSFDVDWNPEFAYTQGHSDLPMGAQGTLSGLDDEKRTKALEYCPELKIFFPSLHSTACFGATPRPLECFKFLCEHGGLRCDEDAALKDGIEYEINAKRMPGVMGRLTIDVPEKD